MRLRNVKNKQEIMDKATNLITNPKDYIGKWNEVFGNNCDYGSSPQSYSSYFETVQYDELDTLQERFNSTKYED